MIIPIKCFTCGKVLADKYDYFIQQVREMKLNTNKDPNEVIYFTKENMEKSPEGIVLDNLGLNKMCCRRHMIAHVDIE